MRAEIESAYGMFDVDDRVKCIVVTGNGRIFCAGADLDDGFGDGVHGEAAEKVQEHRDGYVASFFFLPFFPCNAMRRCVICLINERHLLTYNALSRGGRVTLAIQHCRKPSIAALQGSAVGVGITMTLPMNIRIAYANAKIGFVFARRGLIMEAVSSFFLPRLIGHSRAMQAVTTGSTYLASDKIWGGLFAETCEKAEQVLPRALEVAEDVVRNTSSVSTYLMKELMYRDVGSPEGQHLLDSRVIYELFGSP
jgi:enoyl-CoA hydratase/carnithine racemase